MKFSMSSLKYVTTFPVTLIITLVALLSNCTNDNERKIIYTGSAPKPIGPYSQAVRSGNLLFVSGQIGMTSAGVLDTSSIENECRQVMKNITAIVEAADMKMSDVTKATIYLTDLKNFKKVNEVYGTFFTSDPPARETVEVKALPKGARVEISVVAVN
jgi:2-iminobutanoate/2-iminopropanoate deaminase